MATPEDSAIEYARKHNSQFIDQMSALVAIPSISTDPASKPDMLAAGTFVADYLKELGIHNVQFMGPEERPLVYGEYLKAGADAPTILIYGHYDVQPAAPLDKWNTDPFQPVIHGDYMYGRGASDMKGQVMASIYAIEAILKTGELPVNIKFMIEGEEEVGSPSLPDFIAKHNELLAADFCLNPDTGMLAPNVPAIVYALRGLAYFELRIYGPKQDLHSGTYGGVVHNPAQALCELIAGMHDENGTITLPGFYDHVRPLSEKERTELARLPMNEAYYLGHTGAPALWGEPDFLPVERTGARPTLEVHGLYSGFIDKGSKTVLPAYAMAKLSSRLVPDQTPEEVEQSLRSYLDEHAPSTIRWELDVMTGSAPSISDLESRWVKAMAEAQEATWGVKPLFKREGGSVPVVTQLQTLMGLDAVNIGFGLPDDNIHGPNEKLHLPTWEKGIEALIRFMYNLGS